MRNQGQVSEQPSEAAELEEVYRERVLRSRLTKLATVALLLSLFSLFAGLAGVTSFNVLDPGMGTPERSLSLLFVVVISGIVATSGIVLGNVVLARIRRWRLEKPPTTLARVALIIGYCWWLMMFQLAVVIVAVFIEVPRIIVLQEGKQPWSTFTAAFLLFVVTGFSLFAELKLSDYPVPIAGVVGTLEMGYFATWSLFTGRRDMRGSRRIVYAVVFYSFGIASVVLGWLSWSGL